MVQPAPNLSQGKLIREDSRYSIFDLEVKDSNKSVIGTVSKTLLKPGQDTRGHEHKDKDEWYFFRAGNGFMFIENIGFDVGVDSVIFVKSGQHHQVVNRGIATDLEFITFFSGVSERPTFELQKNKIKQTQVQTQKTQ